MKTIVLRSDLPCAVILFDGFGYSYRKAAYFMYSHEAVDFTRLVSRFSGDIFAVVFFEESGSASVTYYSKGELMTGFSQDIHYVYG